MFRFVAPGQNTRNPGSFQHRFNFLSTGLGKKQTSRPEISMSVIPPKADIAGRWFDVRYVPTADIAPQPISY
jgi:hypothetical protein